MQVVESCPSCSMSLRLFTPRECEKHVNECLDAGTPEKFEQLKCSICGKDMLPLTKAAREEHVNRCMDSLLPKKPRPPRGSSRVGSTTSARVGILPQRSPVELDPKVKSLLDALGLSRYAPKFAAEEIDLDALRLLTDNDLTALRIPDAARRRIAEAMHHVGVLNKIAGEDSSDESPDVPVQLTQNFQESRISGGVSRRAAKIIDNESDDEDDELSGIYDCADSEPHEEDKIASPNFTPSIQAQSPVNAEVVPELLLDDEMETGQDDGNPDKISVEGIDTFEKNVLDSDDEDFETPLLQRMQLKRQKKQARDVTLSKLEKESRGGSAIAKQKVKASVCAQKNNSQSTTEKRTPRVRPPPSKLIPNSQSQNAQDAPSMDSLEDETEAVADDIAPTHGPETLSDLEEWAAEKRQEETERHKRTLNDIDAQYKRMKRKLEENTDPHVEVRVAKKPRPVISNSLIDLTLDDTPVKENRPSSSRVKVLESKDTLQTLKTATVKTPSFDSKKGLTNFKSKLVEDSSSEESSSDEEVLNFSKPLAKILSHRKPASRTGISGGSNCPNPGNDGGIKPRSEHVVSDFVPQISIDDCVQIPDSDDDDSTDVTPLSSKPLSVKADEDHVGTQSSDELMDLTQQIPTSNDPVPQYRLNLDELNTRASCTNGDTIPSSAPVQRVTTSLSIPSLSQTRGASVSAGQRNGSSQGPAGGTQARKSRLRKAKKATTSELRAAIRADPKLLDDMLMMKTVDFERVMASVKSFGLKVSIKGLHEFLTDEGIMFKEYAPASETKTQNTSKFFTSLAVQGFY